MQINDQQWGPAPSLVPGQKLQVLAAQISLLILLLPVPMPQFKKITLKARGPPLLALYRRHLVVDD